MKGQQTDSWRQKSPYPEIAQLCEDYELQQATEQIIVATNPHFSPVA
jgi:hypothetical protein